jgi:hypothetical protein
MGTPNTSVNLSMTASGMDAPPDTAYLSCGRSSVCFAASSSAMYIVGTPIMIVHSLSTSALRAASPENFGSSTTVAPARSAVLSAHVCPKVWNRGRHPSTVSAAVRSKVPSSSVLVCSTRARWLPSAPLGLPVVPLV